MATRDSEGIGPDATEANRTAQFSRALLEHSSDLVALVGQDGRVLYASPAFERILGHKIDAWLGRSMFDLIWPEDLSQAEERFALSLRSPDAVVPWRLRIRHVDGGFRWLEGTSANHLADPATGGLIINGRDVTAHHQAEAALRESEAHLEEAQRIARVGSWTWDARTGIVTWSKQLCVMLDVDPSQPAPTVEQQRALYSAPSIARMESAIRHAMGTGEPYVIEMERRRPEGPSTWLQARGEAVFDGEGRVVGLRGTALDITERKQAEQSLRLKDQAMATSINAIVITDAAGTLIYVNPAFLHLWGYACEEEVLGRPAVDFAEAERTRLAMEQIQAQGTWQGELLAKRKDGTTFEVLLSASSMLDGHGRLVNMTGSFVDVTESKRLEAQFLQAQKMESVGRLAGGVAHDFNNLLTVIAGYVELAMTPLEPDDPLSHYLAEVNKAAGLATGLTQQLLAFSRKQIIDPRILNLNDVVAHVRKMLQRVLGEDIDLQMSAAPELASVTVDAGQVEQILVNLAVNARDAMPEGGTLTLETANVHLDEEYARRHAGVQPGDYVMLAVSDSGAGMSESVKAHLFEPFFTTKEPGKGTGLGLAMVYGAVKQNGGNVEVYSELGHGTTFKIYLPQAKAGGEATRPEARAGLPRGTETIVLVEDDELVRALAVLLLERQGYTVHAFPDGASAIDAVTTMTGPLHLLLTDVIMPGMNGRVLAEQITALRPTIKVLYASGYTANVIAHHGVLKAGIEFLAKPYSMSMLAGRVREVLDTPTP